MGVDHGIRQGEERRRNGKNGEFYKGGSFLPATTMPKRSASGHHSGALRQALVAPGIKVDVPYGQRPIFQQIMNFVEAGQDGKLRILPRLDSPSDPCWDIYGPHEVVQGLVDRFNNGEQFIAITHGYRG